jgi:hypothetical protein
MTTFINALTTSDTKTENGMSTHSTSGSFLVDMFFTMGAARDLGDDALRSLFVKAFGENDLMALKAVFFNRSVLHGQGERRSFRVFFRYLCDNYPQIAEKNLRNIPKHGRWDDIFAAFDTKVESAAIRVIKEALESGDRLCAKWMPRPNKRNKRFAYKLAAGLGLSIGEYRRMIAKLTNVVETQMCSNAWGDINYNHVPSIAAKNYRTAFHKHDSERFLQWIEDLKNPNKSKEVKVNAKAIFPHDIVGPLLNGMYVADKSDKDFLDAQWKALPNFMPAGRGILPVCDVSGSMGMGDGLPMRVCLALGMYCSERNYGPFKDCFMTFSASPKLQQLKGKTLYDRVVELHRAEWEMNTDLEKMFKVLLNQAVKHQVPSAEMPKVLLIMSDMQFDQCTRNPSNTAMQMIQSMYAQAGYECPQVIFWNLRTSSGVPVKFDERGTALLSGFSPVILTSVFKGENLTPMAVVQSALNSKEFDDVTL